MIKPKHRATAAFAVAIAVGAYLAGFMSANEMRYTDGCRVLAEREGFRIVDCR